MTYTTLISIMYVHSIIHLYIGPLPNTVDDFWWLIWQENVQYIVMLTNIMEGTNTKCSQYWPDVSLGSKTYGPLTVTVKEEQSLLHFVVRNMIVKV